jgi:hypothetical protein
MDPDHLFVDSLCNRVQALDACRLVGTVISRWVRITETPAAWRATIRNGLVLEWQVLADNKPVYEILARQ